MTVNYINIPEKYFNLLKNNLINYKVIEHIKLNIDGELVDGVKLELNTKDYFRVFELTGNYNYPSNRGGM